MNVALSSAGALSDGAEGRPTVRPEAQRGRLPDRCELVVIRGIMPRSGTNFVADLLRLHPAMAVNPGDFWEFAPLRFTPLWTKYVAAVEACKHAPGFDAARFEPHIGRAWIDYLRESAPVPATHLVVKEPSVEFLSEQYRMFPGSRTIVVVRDARDLIESALRSGFVLPRRQWWRRRHWRRLLPLGDFRALCRMYAAAGSRLIAFLDKRQDLTQNRQVQVVRYEDVVAETQTRVRMLLTDLGVDDASYDWQGLDTLPVRGSSFLRGAGGQMDFAQGQAKTQAFQPVGRWADWSRPQRRVFEQVAGEVMQQLGYDWDWTPPEAATFEKPESEAGPQAMQASDR